MTWKEENNALTQAFKFKDFVEAWSFMTNLSLELSEAALRIAE